MQARRWALGAYLTGVSLVGLPMLAYAVASVEVVDLRRHVALVSIAALLLVAGELKPIPVARGADAGDELSISSTIAIALLLLMAPGIACLCQAGALFVDEMRGRKAWSRLIFNMSQYTLSLLAARVVFSALTEHPVFSQPGAFRPAALPAALAAAVVFFVLNTGLTGIAVAIAIREPVRSVLPNDLRSHMPTHGVLLALAPVVAQAMAWSITAVPLLIAPLIAVHRSARLASEREHEALHDALTGLPNRALFLARLRQACLDLDRRPLAVMLLDLDHFKEINDTLGHHVGDLLLVEVARRLRGTIREGDLVARLGGDEFAILAFHAGDAGAAMDAGGPGAIGVRRVLRNLRRRAVCRRQCGCRAGPSRRPRPGPAAQARGRRALRREGHARAQSRCMTMLATSTRWSGSALSRSFARPCTPETSSRCSSRSAPRPRASSAASRRSCAGGTASPACCSRVPSSTSPRVQVCSTR